MIHSTYRLLFLSLFLLLGSYSQAQITMGGIPMSLSHPELFSTSPLDPLVVPAPNVAALLAEDEDRDRNGFNLRDAVAVVVDKGLEDGNWTSMPNGARVWRYSVRSSGAYSLEVNFDDLFIPEGGRLFIYDPTGTQILGAYTKLNNKQSGRMSVDMLMGSELILEFSEPADRIGDGRLHIQDLAYRYRDLATLSGVQGGSQSCEVDVACSEGDDWQDQINSVVRVRTRIDGQFFWCTGSLVNNTAMDCSPYILSAMHCSLDAGTQSTTGDFDLYRCYFKYQYSSCGSGASSSASSIAGCIRLADSNDNGGASGSDFLLMELSEDVPSNYDPYYAGWNVASTSSAGGGVGVHHPNADRKKISTFTQLPATATWQAFNMHWRINWVETDNGHGVTEGGSSGSPLFDSNGRIIGTLTGGSSYCNDVQPGGQLQPDYYGKMSKHWTANPNPPEEKLKEWLDPLNTGQITFDGSPDPCGVSGLADLKGKGFKAFPNPSDGHFVLFHAETDPDYRLTVLDITGKEVSDSKYSVRKEQERAIMDLSALENGIYMLSFISTQGDVNTIRVVLSK